MDDKISDILNQDWVARDLLVFYLGQCHSQMEYEEVASKLTSFLDNNQEMWVRLFAINILSTFRDVSNLEPLYELLFNKNVDIRRIVARSITNCSNARTCEVMLHALEIEEDDDVRIELIYNLRWSDDSRAVEPVIKLLEDENFYIRRAAAEALGDLRDVRAVPALIKSLKDENTLVRKVVPYSLGIIGARESVESLIAALKDRDGEVRFRSAEALERIGDPSAIEPLRELLNDRYKIARYQAESAIFSLENDCE